MSLTIVIPLPPAGCSLNAHCHWRVRSKATKEYREQARLAALKWRLSESEQKPVRIHHEWFMGSTATEQIAKALKVQVKAADKCYRPRDTGNAIGALKAAVDGLVDAGIVPDDNHKWVQMGDCVLHRSAKEHKGRSCVVLTLEVIE